MTSDYHCWDKCPCDEKFKALTQTLATERDQFGKREIELMQENRELREALENIKDGEYHSCGLDYSKCSCADSFAKEALESTSDKSGEGEVK